MSRTHRVLLVITGGILLCFWAFYNRYPLAFWDTGAYLYAGYHNEVPQDRPIIYGLFLRHISMADSLWLVVIAQGLMVSLSVFYYFHYLVSARFREMYFLFYLFLVSFLSGASITASYLIPDIFTSIAILNLGLLLLVPNLKIRDLILISVMLVLGIAVHNSHMMIIFALLFLLTCLYLFKRIRKHLNSLRIRRLILTWSLLFLAIVGVSLTHYAFSRNFAISRGSHVFMMGRLADLGILQDYLLENCDRKQYKICPYKYEIPWDFLWDSKHSPVYKTGGWEANKEEYNTIIQDIFSNPKYVKIFLSRSFESSIKLFFTFDVEEIQQQNEGTNTFDMINHKLKMQVKEFFSAKQSNVGIDLRNLNTAQLYLFAISLFCLICLLFNKIPDKYRLLILFILISLYINALVCATFSGAYARYQSRIVWLLPLPLLIILANSPLAEILNRQLSRLTFKESTHE